MTLNADIIPPADPWGFFREWYALAEKNEPADPNAMALATVGAHGMPSVRIVLLKSYDAQGLVFFTNRQSHKGEQLQRHPKAALCLYWKLLGRQIRAEGTVAAVDDAGIGCLFRDPSSRARLAPGLRISRNRWLAARNWNAACRKSRKNSPVSRCCGRRIGAVIA